MPPPLPETTDWLSHREVYSTAHPQELITLSGKERAGNPKEEQLPPINATIYWPDLTCGIAMHLTPVSVEGQVYEGC